MIISSQSGVFPESSSYSRRQGCENFLHLVALFGPVVIPLVQDEPKLETWVGTADVDAMLFAKRNRFVETRMFVSVEHGPDLVVFLERILFTALFWILLNSFFRHSVGNACGGDYFHGN